MFPRGFEHTPDSVVEQYTLFDNTQALMSLEQLAVYVANVRQRGGSNTANVAEAVSIDTPLFEIPEATDATVAAETVKQEHAHSRRQGAFGGALKRRIEQTDSNEKLAATNEADITLLTPLSIGRELFRTSGDQVFRGVLLTPSEFNAVTFSPGTLSRRIGAKVLSGTVGRPATDRHERKAEVLLKELRNRAGKATVTLSVLHEDAQVFKTLGKEMKSPGYAHMPGAQMDALMAHAERVFISMFEAITTNRGAGTERVASLTAALDYLLSSDDYKKTFSYWRLMNTLGADWTKAKIVRFEAVQTEIATEISERHVSTPEFV